MTETECAEAERLTTEIREWYTVRRNTVDLNPPKTQKLHAWIEFLWEQAFRLQQERDIATCEVEALMRAMSDEITSLKAELAKRAST